MPGRMDHIYELLLRATEFAAKNYSREEHDDKTLRFYAECGDVRIDCSVHDYETEGRKGRVRVDDGTGRIVLDGEFCVTNVEAPVIISSYLHGDWELWIPGPGYGAQEK